VLSASRPEERTASAMQAEPGTVSAKIMEPVVPAEEKAETSKTDYRLVLWGLSGLLAVLALTALVVVFRKKSHEIPVVANTTPEPKPSDTAQTSIPQAMLIDVENIISKDSMTLPLSKRMVRVGRDPGNDIVIPHKTISSFHATILFKDGYFYVEDVRSTNGTKLNKKKIKENEPVRLKSGDRIDFADHEFRFLLPSETPLGQTVFLKLD
jgi:hypothetical protein